jgi:hypothetical protein
MAADDVLTVTSPQVDSPTAAPAIEVDELPKAQTPQATPPTAIPGVQSVPKKLITYLPWILLGGAVFWWWMKNRKEMDRKDSDE